MANSSVGTRERAAVLSQEEIALLGIVRSTRRPVGAAEAACRTGMPKGLAALGLALLEDRGLLD
jgi:hypothetical protein